MSRQFIVVDVHMYRVVDKGKENECRVCRIEGGYVNCR